MAKGKKTHWRSKEDLILVETLTEFVSKGISIYEAFDTVSERVGGHRTPQACYARWSNHLEPIYGDAIKLAEKKQPENAKKIVESILEKQKPLEVVHETTSKVELTMPLHSPDISIDSNRMASSYSPKEKPLIVSEGVDSALAFLNDMQFKLAQFQNLQKEYNELLKDTDELLEENDRVSKENEQIRQENERLKLELEEYHSIKEEYLRLKEFMSELGRMCG